jgi:hypothetical protein
MEYVSLLVIYMMAVRAVYFGFCWIYGTTWIFKVFDEISIEIPNKDDWLPILLFYKIRLKNTPLKIIKTISLIILRSNFNPLLKNKLIKTISCACAKKIRNKKWKLIKSQHNAKKHWVIVNRRLCFKNCFFFTTYEILIIFDEILIFFN